MPSATFTWKRIAAGTYTFVSPITGTISVQCWAAGGAGGGATSNAGSAGGGGEYAAELTNSVVAGVAYTVVVGAGGTGVSNATGNAGGNSSFTGGAATTVTAHGGSPGQNNGTTTIPGGTGSTNSAHFDGGTGGTGAGGHVPPIGGGGGGSSGGTGSAGGAGGNGTSSLAGAAGSAPAGAGPGGAGAAPNSGGTGSVPASGPGGGGGGSSGNGVAIAGASGYDGQVIITVVIASPAVISAADTAWSVVYPTGVTQVLAEAVASGAGGFQTGTSGGAGGGAGEYSAEPAQAVTAGVSYALVIGAGGASNAGGNNTTIAGDAVTVTAHGGSVSASDTVGGVGGTGSTNTTHYNGGNGGRDGTTGGGGGGGSGGSGAAGNNGTDGTTTTGGGGAAAVTGGGPGGAGGNATVAGSKPASGPGGGGGGAGYTSTTNGAGFDGQITLTFVLNTTSSGSVAMLRMATSGTVLGGDDTSSGSVASKRMGISGTAVNIAPPAFPAGVLDFMAEIYINGAWTDVSGYVYQRDDIRISRGRPDESSTFTPSEVPITFNNRDGRFSARNPSGPYYGYLARNTPLRISLPEGASYLRSESDSVSYAQCPDAAGLHITGDIEVILDLTLDNWQNAQVLASKWATTGNQRSWIVTVDENGYLWWGSSPDGSTVYAVQSTLPLPQSALKRQIIQVLVFSGSVSFFFSVPGSAAIQQVGAVVPLGSSTIFTSATPVQVGFCTDFGTDLFVPYTGYNGKIHSFSLYNGFVSPVLVANPDFTSRLAGTTSFTDAQANAWTLQGTCEISSRKYRFHGEVATWPQLWDPSGKDVYIQTKASGISRRLGQGVTNKPLNSTMWRGLMRLASPYFPVAYWPGEDALGASSLASAIGGPPMTFTKGATLASDSSFACSLPTPVFNSTIWTGTVPSYKSPVTPNANVFRFNLSVPVAGDTDGAVIASIYTSGTVKRLDLVYGLSGGALTLNAITAAGTTSSGSFSFGLNGTPVRVSMEIAQSGANVLCSAVTLVPGASTGSVENLTINTATVGNVTKVVMNPNANLVSTAAGHMAVQAAYQSLFALGSQLAAWKGEPAGSRIVRLCGEEGIPVTGMGSADDTALMGAQTPLTLLSLLQECETTDMGMLYEPRQMLGLGYRTRYSLCSQAPAVTLDYSLAHLSPPLQPVDDDQRTRNDVTVSRSYGGSSARAFKATGALNIQPPPNGVGLYAVNIQANPWTDGQLPDMAGWLLNLGTVDEPRYPQINVDLSRAVLASLYYQLQDMDIGDRLFVINTPSWMPPEGITQLVFGISEICYSKFFRISWNCAPESPYEIALVGDMVYGRADTDGSQLHAGVDSVTATLLVDTLVNPVGGPFWPLWTTNASTGWSYTVSGTPFNFNYFVVTTAQSASIKAGDLFTISGIPGEYQVTALGVPFLGFVNVFFSPSAPSVVSNPNVVTNQTGDFPFDINVGGERMTVTVITGSSSPQTFTVIRSVNGVVKSHLAGESVSLFYPPIISI